MLDSIKRKFSGSKSSQQPAPSGQTNTQAPPTNTSSLPQQTLGNQTVVQILTQDEIEMISNAKLYDPLRAKLLDKFGVGRKATFRSKELNEFRAGLKKAARDQAKTDIAAHVSSGQSHTGQSNISQQFYSLMANREAYASSKGSVDEIMKQKSNEIIESLLPTSTVYNQLQQASLTHSSITDSKEQKKKAISSAQAKATSLLELFQDQAVDKARHITKGTGQEAENKRTGAIKDVTDQVTTDKVGENAFKKVVTAESVNSGLKKIAPIIQTTLPADGDAASMEFELKIPITSGVYASIGLGAEAENEGDHFTLGTDISLGAGVSAGITDVAVKLGMFIEAKGSSVQSALNLMSYGMYRNLNVRLPSLAQYLWGMGEKSGKTQLEESEIWAATIEANELSNDDNYVDVGQSLSASVDVETGVFTGEFEASAERFTKYNKENISALATQIFGDETDTSLAALTMKSKRINEMATHKRLNLSASTEFDLAFAKLAFSGEGSATFYNGKLDGLEAEISVDLPSEIAGVNGWDYIVKEAIPGFISVASRIEDRAKGQPAPATTPEEQLAQDKEKKSKLHAQVEQQADELSSLISQLSGLTAEDPDKAAFSMEKSSGITLTLGLERDYENGVASDWNVEFDISKKSSLEIKAGILNIELEKTRKLFSIGKKNENGVVSSEHKFYRS